MRRIMRRPPSAAMIVAVLALVAGVTGAAVASPVAKKVTTKKVKKIANKEIDKRAPDLESHAFNAVGGTNVNMPAGPGTTTAATLDLPAGTYLIVARTELNNNAAAVNSGLDCKLVAEADTGNLARNLHFAANGAVGDDYPASGQLVHTFAAAGQARLDCVRSAAWTSGNVLDPTISAVSVQP